MSFLYNLADINYKTAVFYQSGSWIKPQGITMISITAIGAGGGGGGGLTGANTLTRTGGPGGGSGGISRIIIPEMFITDSLIITIGVGGNGAAAGGTGGNGGNTSVDMVTPGNRNIYTFIVTASGGTGGNGSTNVAGVGGTSAAIGNSIYSSLGMWFATGGDSGDIGSNVGGNGLTYGRSGIPLTGGAGGGGMAANVTAATQSGWVTGNVSPQPMIAFPERPAAGGNGENGTFSLTPFYSLGGSGGGGGGNTPNSGGRGGDGNIGSGGGGGGGGTSPTGVGGTGGKGGDGLVIIQCW
jgi:hypothetical protein